MILRSIVEGLRSQSWGVAFMELLIVVVGVFIGLQVDSWNDARSEAERREQFIVALATYLSDMKGVQERVIAEVELIVTTLVSSTPEKFMYELEFESDQLPNQFSP